MQFALEVNAFFAILNGPSLGPDHLYRSKGADGLFSVSVPSRKIADSSHTVQELGARETPHSRPTRLLTL